MHRLVATVLLLLLAVCQAFAMSAQEAAPGRDVTEASRHTLMHWEGVAHHHHDDDGSAHQDSSQESAQHMLADMIGAAAVLPPAPLAVFLPERAPLPRTSPESSGPSTYPDGPRRPPRLNT